MAGPTFDYAASAPWQQAILAHGDLAGTNRAILDMVENGMTKDECWEAIWDEEVRRFESDPTHRDAVRALFDEAGVDVLSVTPWVHDKTVSESVGQRRDLSRWQARFSAADWLHKVTSPADAREVADAGDLGIILNTQNVGGAIDGQAQEVETLYNEGVRLFQLTYNYQNLVGTGCGDPSAGGLSSFGRDVVDRITGLGGVVDLSHCGKRTTLDTIEYADAPVAVTHAACQSVYDHYRGKSDEEIEALADADGYMGIVALPWFVAPAGSDPGIDTLLDHLDHAASILGTDRIGLGTDFFPADVRFPAELLEYYKRHIISLGFDAAQVEQRTGIAGGLGDFETYADWSAIEAAVRDRFGDDAEGILGGNFLEFWERSRAA